MTAKKKPPVIDMKAFQAVFVEAEQVMKANLVKLIKSRLDKETNFDARMAYKICIKLIETGTLDDVIAVDSVVPETSIDGNESDTQGTGSGVRN